MPTVQAGVIDFPGTDAFRGEFALGHGVTPSMGGVTCSAIDVLGICNVTFGDGERAVTLNGCLPGEIHFDFEARAAPLFNIQFFDRRWKWAYSEISGEYNVPTLASKSSNQGAVSGGTQPFVISETDKPPQELAHLLFRAMGEPNADVSALPNDARPYVYWDHANAAQELASLCDLLNCRVVLQPDNSVKIVRLNEGSQLPLNGYDYADQSGVRFRQAPDVLRVVCGPTRYQVRLPLEAVGLDKDGQIKPLDQLSYKPKAGWDHEWHTLPSIPDPLPGGASDFVSPDGSRHSLREIGLRSVYRWYRVKQDGIDIPGYGKVTLKQILPLNDALTETFVDSDGGEKRKPAIVSGIYFHEQRQSTENTDFGTRLDIPFSVDAEHGIAQVGWPIWKLPDNPKDGTIQPAELYLHVEVYVKDSVTRIPDRHAKDRRLTSAPARSGGGETVRTYIRDDIFRTIISQYDRFGNVSKFIDNKQDVEKQCDYYLDEAVKEFSPLTTKVIPYGGIHPIQLDGIIQQVSWRVAGGTDGGAFTQASRGLEASLNVPNYREKRDRELRAKIDRDFAAVKAWAAKQGKVKL